MKKKICVTLIISMLITLCMPGISLAADNYSLTNKLIAADGQTGEMFGYSVAISGDIAVVGAYVKDSYQGAVYVHNLYTGSVSKLVASDGEAGDIFGYSVAIFGDLVVVGAPGDDDNGSESGSVYIYDLSQGNLETKITAFDGAVGDYFGWSVAVSEDVVLIGAHAASGGTGAAYVYDVSLDTQTKITADDGEAGDLFGISVAISADNVLVGAYHDTDNPSSPWKGAAYLFDLADLSGQTKLVASDGASEDCFGWSVALSANYAVVGAKDASPMANNSGAAYVYELADLSNETKLVPSDLESYDKFGASVSVSGNKVLVGSSGNNDVAASAGAAYLYDLTDSSTTKITANDGAANDNLGFAVAISGTNIIIGSICDDDKGVDSGSAYYVYAPESNVTFNNLGGSGEDSVIAVYGEAMPSGLDAPTKDDYTFMGYYSNLYDASSKYYNPDMTSAQNWDVIGSATLYAKWEVVAVNIDTESLSEATVGESYTCSITASGGAGGYLWYAKGLPEGVSIDSNTGIISGIANQSGDHNVNIRVYDSLGNSADKNFTLTVNTQSQTGKYSVVPFEDGIYTVNTADGFTTLVINDGVSGFHYIRANITPTIAHEGEETVVFVHLRNGVQIGFSCTTADFDIVDVAGAGFNMHQGDEIKIYVVDQISNDPSVVPVLLQ